MYLHVVRCSCVTIVNVLFCLIHFIILQLKPLKLFVFTFICWITLNFTSLTLKNIKETKWKSFLTIWKWDDLCRCVYCKVCWWRISQFSFILLHLERKIGVEKKLFAIIVVSIDEIQFSWQIDVSSRVFKRKKWEQKKTRILLNSTHCNCSDFTSFPNANIHLRQVNHHHYHHHQKKIKFSPCIHKNEKLGKKLKC